MLNLNLNTMEFYPNEIFEKFGSKFDYKMHIDAVTTFIVKYLMDHNIDEKFIINTVDKVINIITDFRLHEYTLKETEDHESAIKYHISTAGNAININIQIDNFSHYINLVVTVIPSCTDDVMLTIYRYIYSEADEIIEMIQDSFKNNELINVLMNPSYHYIPYRYYDIYSYLYTIAQKNIKEGSYFDLLNKKSEIFNRTPSENEVLKYDENDKLLSEKQAIKTSFTNANFMHFKISENSEICTQKPTMIKYKDFNKILSQILIDTFIFEIFNYNHYITMLDAGHVIDDTIKNKINEFMERYCNYQTDLYELFNNSYSDSNYIDKVFNKSIDINTLDTKVKLIIKEQEKLIANLYKFDKIDDNAINKTIEELVDSDKYSEEDKTTLTEFSKALAESINKKIDDNKEILDKLNNMNDNFANIFVQEEASRFYHVVFSLMNIINKKNDNNFINNNVSIFNDKMDELRKKYGFESNIDNLFKIYEDYYEILSDQLHAINNTFNAFNTVVNNTIEIIDNDDSDD